MAAHTPIANSVAAPAAATHAARVAVLNDALRRTFVGGRVVATTGFAALPEATRTALLAAVRNFETFDDDPHGERDFGAVEAEGTRCFWKIDTYDRELRYASPDPADPTVTVRVLTLMLAAES